MRLSVVGSVIIFAFSQGNRLFSRDDARERIRVQHRKASSTNRRNRFARSSLKRRDTDSYRERRGMARGVNVVDGLKFCLKHDSSRGEGGGEKNVKQRDLRKARDRGEWDGMRWIKGIVHF